MEMLHQERQWCAEGCDLTPTPSGSGSRPGVLMTGFHLHFLRNVSTKWLPCWLLQKAYGKVREILSIKVSWDMLYLPLHHAVSQPAVQRTHPLLPRWEWHPIHQLLGHRDYPESWSHRLETENFPSVQRSLQRTMCLVLKFSCLKFHLLLALKSYMAHSMTIKQFTNLRDGKCPRNYLSQSPTFMPSFIWKATEAKISKRLIQVIP